MPNYATANDILNRVAPEIGVSPVSNPYGSANRVFTQMRYLLDAAGQELIELYPWQQGIGEHQITTAAVDSGNYTLPTDFSYMIDQTGWERANDQPLYGPLSAQDWTYLLGSGLVSSTIHASFRLKDGKFSIFPQPPVDGLDINFEYMKNTWVEDGTSPGNYLTVTGDGSDIIRYEPILIQKLLKAKYLEAKGFDSTAARKDFGYVFDSRTGKDKSAPVLNASGQNTSFLLDARRNTPYTGYGS